MSSIVTFYSYKGGVGRSMALANIAVLLARRGLKVLVVDWDLEAPGLERYFGYFEIAPGGPGLLRMFMEADANRTADFRHFTSSFNAEGPHEITLLASGREQDESYTRNLEAFDWEAFFAKDGGEFVEELRHRWREEFDIVLIDSRTGLSDTGGICTIQLPDIVVAMFTANYQSLYGVRDIMRLAQKARQGLAYDRMPISVLPIPCRWGVHEFQETQVWLDRICEGVEEFYADWLPRGYHVRDLLERLKIPQADYFGFGEKLAVVEQGTADPQGMGFVYDKVATFLASDLKDLAGLVGESATQAAESNRAKAKAVEAAKPPEPEGYRHDIFVSYDSAISELVLEFVEALKPELAALRATPPRIFIDVQEIRIGDDWYTELSEALVRSKALLAIVTSRYVGRPHPRKEFYTFAERSRETGKQLVVPVFLRGDPERFPEFVTRFQGFDLRYRGLQKAPRSRPSSQREIMDIAKALSDVLDTAPAFNPNWQFAHDVPSDGLSPIESP